MLDFTKILNDFYLTLEGLRNSFVSLFSQVFVKVYLSSLLILNITIWSIAKYIGSNIGQEQIALHYSVDFGIDLYGRTGYIYIVPLLGLLFIIINFLVLLSLRKYNVKDVKFISHILLGSAVIANIILVAAIISIYIINFR